MGDKPWKDGVPCNHPGCFNHITHPCEGCGRIGGKYPMDIIADLREANSQLASAAIEEPPYKADLIKQVAELTAELKGMTDARDTSYKDMVMYKDACNKLVQVRD